MTIQSRLDEWLKAKGQDISAEEAEQVAAEAQDFCYTCARVDELKRVVLTAAYHHLKRRLERGDIMGKIVLVVNRDCPPCDEVTQVLRPLINEGEIEVVDYDVCEECDREAITKAGISTFPSMAIRSEDGLMVSPLSLAPKEEKTAESEEAEELEGIKRGLRDFHEGRVKPLSEVQEELEQVEEPEKEGVEVEGSEEEEEE